LIEESTAILNKRASGKVLRYVAIQENPEINRGMSGEQVDLSAVHAPTDFKGPIRGGIKAVSDQSMN
jgi:hypothetical protein